MTLQEFAQRCGGTLNNADPNATMSGFATDSRDVHPGTLFLAIKGANVDGHEFIPQALAQGAIAALTEKSTDHPHILVDNLVYALAKFASSKRQEFNGPVIGVTGSAGKTSTKEFVSTALSPLGPILKTHGNRNTEYTVPLIWAELKPEHRAAVIEMSMRGFKQVAHLAAFSKPTIGIITNIGYAHIEMVGSREGIAEAKGELLEALPEDGFAVLPVADPYLGILIGKTSAQIRTFGFSGNAYCHISQYKPLSWTSCEVTGEINGKRWKAVLPAVGQHMALNAAAAIMAAYCAGVDPAEAAEALAKAELPPMRMEVREINGATIVLDTYNASPPSMIAALEALADLPASGRRIAIIGEMRELGEHAAEGHKAVGAEIARHHLDEVLFVGEATKPAQEQCRAAGTHFTVGNLKDVHELLTRTGRGDVVLIKGSRALELEKALEGLPEMAR
jgi:UDP-N-acetylmuramoyl-tripeptide--D-alanyl-D-alanine ligase